MTLRITVVVVAFAAVVVTMVWLPAAVPTSGSSVRLHLADGPCRRGQA